MRDGRHKISSSGLRAGLVLAMLMAGCGGSPTGTEPMQLEITGFDYNWHIHYPGPDGRLDTRDDVWSLRHLRLPAGTPVELRLLSRDFLYNFWLPRYDMYQIAVPDVPMVMQFNTGDAGEAQLLGDQMCGFSHENLIGRLEVMDRQAFRRWLDEQRPRSAAAELPGDDARNEEREG